MSFSIGATANTKDEVRAAIAQKFDDEVVKYQTVHAKDRALVLATLDAQLHLLHDEPHRTFCVTVWGSLSYIYGEDGGERIEGVTTHCEINRGIRAE